MHVQRAECRIRGRCLCASPRPGCGLRHIRGRRVQRSERCGRGFRERVPLVVISGGPRLSLRKDSEPRLLHHILENKQVELEIFRKVTAAAAILADPADAPRQIDEALATCLREHRPVYLEIPMDMVAQPCGEPGPLVAETTMAQRPGGAGEGGGRSQRAAQASREPGGLGRRGSPATRGSGKNSGRCSNTLVIL